jgi:hypothetical protein
MHPQYNGGDSSGDDYDKFLRRPPDQGKAYILLLDDPEDEDLWGFEVWTTKAPGRYIHSKMFYAFRDPQNKLNAFLLKLKEAGRWPHVELMQVVDADDAPAILKARERRRKRGD